MENDKVTNIENDGVAETLKEGPWELDGVFVREGDNELDEHSVIDGDWEGCGVSDKDADGAAVDDADAVSRDGEALSVLLARFDTELE